MISLVIPVYNYEKGLSATLDKLRTWRAARTDIQEIIFVDDGSSDATPSILKLARPPFRVITLPKNSGKGAAVKKGMLESTGEFVFFTDADLPYDLSAIDASLEKFRTGADVVTGSRFASGSEFVAKRRRERELSSKVFSFLANRILLARIHDTQCGFKGFSRSAITALFPEQREGGYIFDVELLFLAQSKNLRIETVPVTLVTESASSIRLIKDSLKMMTSLAKLYLRARIHMTRRDGLLTLALGTTVAILLTPTLENTGAFAAISRHGIPSILAVFLLVLFMPLAALAGTIVIFMLPLSKSGAKELSRYAVIGVFNTALNAAIFNSLIYFSGISTGILVTVFALITYVVVISQSFYWNAVWTFRDSNAGASLNKGQYARFLAVTAATSVLNLGIIQMLVNVVGAPSGITPAAWANVALLLTIVTALIGNFFGYKFFVFPRAV